MFYVPIIYDFKSFTETVIKRWRMSARFQWNAPDKDSTHQGCSKKKYDNERLDQLVASVLK